MIEVLIFYSHDSDVEAAKKCKQDCVDAGYSTRLIDKLGFTIEELQLAARYKVVTTPTTIVLQDDRVILRRTALYDVNDLKHALDFLERADSLL